MTSQASVQREQKNLLNQNLEGVVGQIHKSLDLLLMETFVASYILARYFFHKTA